MTNQDEIEGTARNIGGKLQDAIGGLTGDASTQARGKFNQAAGNAQRTFGDAADELRDNITSSPLTALAVVAGTFFVLGYLSRR